MNRITRICASAALAVLLLISAHSSIRAHSWYDQSCCSDRDCHPVNSDDLVEVENGCWKYLPTGARFCGNQVKPSQDKHWHVCVSNTGIPYRAYI